MAKQSGSVYENMGVWQPGTDVRLGDFGQISEGCFMREGNITEFTSSDLQAVRSATLQTIFLTSAHAVQVGHNVEEDTVASVEFSFAKEGRSTSSR